MNDSLSINKSFITPHRQNGATESSAEYMEYVGEFKDCKTNEKGAMRWSNGSIQAKGIWKDGEFIEK
jgi:hypothetical protein